MGRSSAGNFASNLQYVPLLAVLICTVGALVVLVLALARHGGQRAIAAIKANAAQQSNADLAAEREGLQWKIDHLRQSRDKSQHQLADKQLELSHVEDHTRQLREQADRLQLAIDQLENQGRSVCDEHQKAEAELARLRSAITESEHEVRDTERSKINQPTTYSVVPYEGPNQTKRRPIYIECRNDSVILQPEGLKFQESDFMPPLGPGNPLAAAIRAYSESLASRGLTNETTRPYPMLLVRPDGIEAYYAARSALTSWGAEFGYELVGADWSLDFPPTDATLAATLQQVVDDARVRQEALAIAAPRQFKQRGRSVLRASPNGGFVREEDPRGGGNGGSSGRYARRGTGSAERPFGGGSGRGSASATGQGNSDTPGDGSGSYAGGGAYTGGGNELGGGGNSGTSGGAAFGETANAGNPGGRYSSGGGSEVGNNSGQSSGDSILGDPSGGSRYSSGTQAGQLGNASADGGSQFGPNDTAGANGGAGNSNNNAGSSNNASSSSLAGGPGSGSGSTNTGGGNGSQQRSFGSGSQGASNSSKNPYGKFGSPGEGYNSNSQQSNASGSGGGAPGSRSAATGASGGSAGGNSASGGTASSSGGSSSSLGSSSSAGASGGSDASQSSPSLQMDPTQQPAASAQFEKKKPKSLAKSRGRDWGLPEGSNTMTPMTRPVIIRCAADKLTIVPDDKRTLPVDIKLGPRTEDSVDELVDGVWTHMKGWGLAGRGLYWRPTLVMEVAPGSEARFHELQGLLADSGLEVRAREKPSTATAPAGARRK